MKKIFFLFFSFLIIVNSYSFSKPLGLGIFLGEPTGITGKYKINNKNSINSILAWSFDHDAALHISTDYVFYKNNLLAADGKSIPLYYGLGGRAKFTDDFELGLRIPFGIDYTFDNNHFDLFFEIAPIMNIVPSTKLKINGGIGIRYFFDIK